jgi:NAD(P)H-flavin reductase
MPVHTTTDDGSAGDQCLVTHPVELAVQDSLPDIIYACGPLEMLQCVLGIVEKYEVPSGFVTGYHLCLWSVGNAAVRSRYR